MADLWSPHEHTWACALAFMCILICRETHTEGRETHAERHTKTYTYKDTHTETDTYIETYIHGNKYTHSHKHTETDI